MIAVIDYKAGNLTSVVKALRHLGAEDITAEENAMERTNLSPNKWRSILFCVGFAVLALSIVGLFFADRFVPSTEPLSEHLWRLLRLAEVGWTLDALAFVLVLFGRGWKRLPLVIACLLSALLWNAVIAY